MNSGIKSDNFSGNSSWCCLRYSRMASKMRFSFAWQASLSAGSRVCRVSIESSAPDVQFGKLRTKATSKARNGSFLPVTTGSMTFIVWQVPPTVKSARARFGIGPLQTVLCFHDRLAHSAALSHIASARLSVKRDARGADVGQLPAVLADGFAQEG